MEPSDGGVTEVEIVEGVEYHKGFSHGEFITDKEKNISELDNALVLLMDSKVDSIRQVQPVLEHVIKKNKAC